MSLTAALARFIWGIGMGTLIAAAAVKTHASDPVGIYALLDKIVFEPAGGHPERVQLWGAFKLAEASGYTYSQPALGYMYFRVNPQKPEVSRIEWKDPKKMAGSGQVVGFGSRYGEKGRVRKRDEKVA